MCIRISKTLSAKCYQENIEGIQKELAKNIKIILKKKKSRNMVMNVTNEKKRLVIKNNDLESSFEKTILKP